MSDNKLKYLRVDAAKREAMRRQWNQPVLWPTVLLVLLLMLSIVPAVLSYRKRERMAARPAV